MIVQLRYNYRIYPTQAQQQKLMRAFGCARVVYNDGLRLRRAAYEAGLPRISPTELQKRVVTEAKRTPERAWLAEAPYVVLSQALRDLNAAYANFFASLAGKRGGRKVGAPRLRSKKDGRQAIRFTRRFFSIRSNGQLHLATMDDIKVRWSRSLPSKPSSVTVIKDASGRYFASFVIETRTEPLPEVQAEVGIDLGLSHFAVLSDGQKVASPRFLRRAERRLKRVQQALTRKEKGSANEAKARLKFAKSHAKVADARRDWTHKLSTRIVRENQAVYVEDLNVHGIARNRRLAKSVHDAGWAQFVSMLEYKAARYGRHFAKIGRFEPTSQVCSACGVKDGPKPLHIRKWTCLACSAVHDRDLNAAKNILAAGRADRLNACGGDVRPPFAVADASEAGTPRSAA